MRPQQLSALTETAGNELHNLLLLCFRSHVQIVGVGKPAQFGGTHCVQFFFGLKLLACIPNPVKPFELILVTRYVVLAERCRFFLLAFRLLHPSSLATWPRFKKRKNT